MPVNAQSGTYTLREITWVKTKNKNCSQADGLGTARPLGWVRRSGGVRGGAASRSSSATTRVAVVPGFVSQNAVLLDVPVEIVSPIALRSLNHHGLLGRRLGDAPADQW